MDAVSFFDTLPVFQLIGGTAAERQRFKAALGTSLGGDWRWLSVGQTEGSSTSALSALARRYDFIVVEGETALPLHRIHLLRKKNAGDCRADKNLLIWAIDSDPDLVQFRHDLFSVLDRILLKTPVWACVLIGGKSSRMGRPKHLITDKNGTTWLEKTISTIRPLVAGMIVSGQGELPVGLTENVIRLPDIPGVSGPLTGLVSCGRWLPHVSWLLLACDMPNISAQAVQWLLAGRQTGVWGCVPQMTGKRHFEPLFAWYDFRAIPLFEEQIIQNEWRIGKAAHHEKITNPVIPQEFRTVWENINTPAQLTDVSE